MNGEYLSWMAIVAAIASLLGVITKFVLDWKKQASDAANKDIDRFEARIVKLEKDNEVCMAQNAEFSRKLGEAQGEIRGLKTILEEVNRSNRLDASEDAANRTAEKAVEKVEERVETAVARAIESPPVDERE